MKGLRPARLIVALATVFILAGTASIASARSEVTNGLHLIGTDAAFVRFVAPVDACHGLDLFVGYVQADGLQSPIGDGRPHFHSDVDAFLTVFENAETEGCGSDQLHLMGGRGLIDSDQVEIVALESATLDGFEMTVTGVEGGDPVTVVMTLDFTWTGEGDVFTETIHGPGDHSAHRTVAATVSGTLTIESVDGGGALATALSALAGQGPVADLNQTEGVITHYQQIIINIP
jgi:hypothetical protein